MKPASLDFSALHTSMQRWVENDYLPGVSVAVLTGRDQLHTHCVGWADKEQRVTLREDHLFRIYSNTKLITSCVVLQLLEEGRLALEDPIERFLPALGQRQVLKPGAKSLAEVVPARGPITIGQLLSHSSGLSYGLLDPGTLMFEAYTARNINSRELTLEQMVQALAPLPLAFEPGTSWEYSIATDVLARTAEVICAQPFDRVLRERIFEPLQLADTGFFVPEAQHHRLAGVYQGASLQEPMRPGLARAEHLLRPPANLRPAPLLSGGGGLVSSLPDMVKLLRALMPGGAPSSSTLLKPATLALLARNQLAKGCFLQFPGLPALRGRSHGLAGGVVLTPNETDHPQATGEIYWGGMAGTMWWISPAHDFAAAVMTQRWLGFGHPYGIDIKREVYNAVLGAKRST